MFRLPSVAAVAFALLLAPTSHAYGTLEPANEAGTAARPVVEKQLAFLLYGFYGQDRLDPVFDGRHYKVNFTDGNRTWTVYHDADDDYRQDPGEENVTSVPVVLVQAHGNLTEEDHVLVMVLPLKLRAGVCPHQAAEGAGDGLARGARCNGDLDRDGREDFAELASGQSPVSADDARLVPLP